MKNLITSFSTQRPRQVFVITLLITLLLGFQIPRMVIDTDPENMLPHDHTARLTHNKIRDQFTLYDVIVVGVVNEKNPDGIFQSRTLHAIHQLTNDILKIDGVINKEVMSLSTVDNISQSGSGAVRFEWMMQQSPQSKLAAIKIREAVARLPMLNNTIVSADGQAAAIYVPITSKKESYRIAKEIESLTRTIDSNDEFHITGLPVAEDTFGVEMFNQMAVSAPAAALVIFLLMWFFFQNVLLVLAPMLVAMITVISTMGLFISTGNTVHIMSSMIPIFLMPIAVVDSIHILSEFVELHSPGKDIKQTIREMIDNLFNPMLFTSITSAVGFASLAFTPIPPVQLFGLYVAFGILFAFLLTITFIPAYLIVLKPQNVEQLSQKWQSNKSPIRLKQTLPALGIFSIKFSKPIILSSVVVICISIYGISQIQINDNPIRWFQEKHPIRIADAKLNKHFAGTYSAFLVLNREEDNQWLTDFQKAADTTIFKHKHLLSQEHYAKINADWQFLLKKHRKYNNESIPLDFQQLQLSLDDIIFGAENASQLIWEDLLALTEKTVASRQFFQTPDALHYVSELQHYLQQSGYVGKSNSLADLIKTIYRELNGGGEDKYTVPPTSNAIAQSILSFQSSHRPNDLWHMVTPDFRSSAIWLQLKSGDNKDMAKVLEIAHRFIDAHPLSSAIRVEWGGLTYINTVWQEHMVEGMLNSLLSAFFVVFIMMILLFRSFLFGLLAIIPLTITITFIYGFIGIVGKDYDMPIAVLSALTLGLSVDFAIHFLERFRSIQRETAHWPTTINLLFEEPVLAIVKNAIVIAMGFLPLLASPLIPYKTVGLFLGTIMTISCLVTLLLLPAILAIINPYLFKNTKFKNA